MPPASRSEMKLGQKSCQNIIPPQLSAKHLSINNSRINIPPRVVLAPILSSYPPICCAMKKDYMQSEPPITIVLRFKQDSVS